MNERIDKLFGQAMDQVVPETWTTLTHSQLSILKDKFAELIVQECLTFVRPNSYFQAYPENMIGGEDGVKLLQTITNQIEEHFGVEE